MPKITLQYAPKDKFLYLWVFFCYFWECPYQPTQGAYEYKHKVPNLWDNTFALGFHRMDRVITVIFVVGINTAATDTQGIAGQITLAWGIRRLPVESRACKKKFKSDKKSLANINEKTREK